MPHPPAPRCVPGDAKSPIGFAGPQGGHTGQDDVGGDGDGTRHRSGRYDPVEDVLSGHIQCF